MKYLGENFIKKIVDWIKDREVWTFGTGEGSIITVYNKSTISENQGAIGEGAVAEGRETTAKGSYSHAEGFQISADGYAAHAQGVYNVDNKNAIHTVGIGKYDFRKNAEYIYVKNNTNGTAIVDDPKNGYKYLIGVGGYNGFNTDNTTYKSVQEVIADLTARIEQLETLVANCVSISNVDEQTNQ